MLINVTRNQNIMFPIQLCEGLNFMEMSVNATNFVCLSLLLL